MPVDRDAPLVLREDLGGPYVRLTFEHPEVAHTARAGQFVMLQAARPSPLLLRRPFSVLDTDAGAGTFRVFLKAVGPGSAALASLRPGESAHGLGPLGHPFDPPAAGSEAVLVAGGYGIAPFHLFSRQQSARPRLFYGGRTAADLKLHDDFERLGVPVTLATEDGSLGERGRVTVPLEAWLDVAPGPVQLYACGPEPMMHAVARIAARRGLPAQVSLDPWMGCGIGTCLGCVVRVQRADEERPHHRCACKDGPVFDARIVVWPGDAASAARAPA